MSQPAREDDRFAPVAAHYDRWVDWEPRLKREMPFLLESLPVACSVLDAGCGTGVHARALAAAGRRVSGIDRSAAMLTQARAAEDPQGSRVEWIEGDVCDPSVLGDRRFDGVLALGNVLPAFGEPEEVRRGLESMIRLVAPGGVLILQYLNGSRIRKQGRLVVKATEAPSPADSGEELWLRHHFEAAGQLWFHSYQIRREGQAWTAEVRAHPYADLPVRSLLPLLESTFSGVELFDGLTGRPFNEEESDSLGVRASRGIAVDQSR